MKQFNILFLQLVIIKISNRRARKDAAKLKRR